MHAASCDLGSADIFTHQLKVKAENKVPVFLYHFFIVYSRNIRGCSNQNSPRKPIIFFGMVLNYIWIAFFLIAFVTALAKLIFWGDTTVFPAIMDSTFTQAKTAFELSLGLTGVLALWMGIMKIGEKGGLVKGLAKLLSPVLCRIFPDIPKGHPAMGTMFMNFSANMLGLDFDVSKGARLATYAARCVENEILMYFRSMRKTAQDVSLSDCIETGTDGAALSLMDVVAEDCDLLEQVSTKEQVEALRRAVDACLTEQERQVVVLRYGLGGAAPLRQREVAQLTGISRSYVSRIEKKALEKLREALEA